MLALLYLPERMFQVAAPELPADFPPLRTLESYRHNLPAQPTPLIGREAEVLSVRDCDFTATIGIFAHPRVRSW